MYKVHLDGVDQTPILTGTGPSNRTQFFYFTETKLHGLRLGDYKFLFTHQDRWFNGVQERLVTPVITNLKLDPLERFEEARGFDEWQENRSWLLAPAGEQLFMLVQSLKAYPPRQKSFNIDIDDMMNSLYTQPAPLAKVLQ